MSNQQHGSAGPSRIVTPGALATAGSLVALTLAAAFLLPHGPRDAGFAPGTVERQRLLRFADRQDGAVVVTDAADGRLAGLVTGESGFLRGTMSGLARIRRMEGIGAEPPFRLTLYDNDRLVLDDPSTGKSIDLEAFGSTNEAVFALLLSS
jgi:putative photosynthetic complex assembly protein